MSEQNHLKRAVRAVTALRGARYLRDARVAFLVAGLALMLLSCGSRNARPLGDASVRPSLPGSSVIYVVNTPPGLIPVDLAHHRTAKPIALPSDGVAVDVTSDRRTAYVMVGTSLVPIALTTGARGRPIAVPSGSSAYAIAPDRPTAYVLDGGAIVPVDLRTGRAGRRIIVPDLSAPKIIIAAGGRAACVTGTTTFRAEPPIRVPSYPYSITDIVLAPDGRNVYVAAYSAVIPIDLLTRKAARPIPMPAGIQAITLAP